MATSIERKKQLFVNERVEEKHSETNEENIYVQVCERVIDAHQAIELHLGKLFPSQIFRPKVFNPVQLSIRRDDQYEMKICQYRVTYAYQY